MGVTFFDISILLELLKGVIYFKVALLLMANYITSSYKDQRSKT